VAALRISVDESNLTETARESRKATLEMTEERLRHVEDRKRRLAEIEGDIDRIEAQLDLSLERAALLSSGHRGGFQLDLATRMVQRADLFGSTMPMVDDLDSHFKKSEL
jgi:Tfp pilus assembly protein PilO